MNWVVITCVFVIVLDAQKKEAASQAQGSRIKDKIA